MDSNSQLVDPGPSQPAQTPSICKRDIVNALASCGNNGWAETVDYVTSLDANIYVPYYQQEGDTLVLYHSFMNVQAKYQKIKAKYRGAKQAEEIEKFVGEDYMLPQKTMSLTPRKRKLQAELKILKADLKRAQRSMHQKDGKLSQLEMFIECYDGMRLELGKHAENEQKVKTTEQKCNAVQKELKLTTGKLHDSLQKLSKYKPRNANKREKRKDEKIQSPKTELEKLHTEVKQQIERLQVMFDKLKHATATKLNLQKRVSFLKKSQNVVESIQKNKTEIKELKQKISDLERENDYLQAMSEIADQNVVSTFCNGRYTNEIREVVLEILNMNVSADNVSKVISCVLEKLS